ncbi:MAG: NUDIX hydrolase [Halobacterium sp.]
MSTPGGRDHGRRLASLEREYGAFDVVEEETVVPRAVYTDCLQAAEAGSLGGARVFLFHDGEVLLVRYRDQSDTWDLPGGPTERGESFADTAELRVLEDVGVSCSLTGIDRVLEQTFALVEGGDGVTGYWVFFEAEAPSTEFEPSEDVLEARWFDVDDVPGPIGPHVEARLGGD